MSYLTNPYRFGSSYTMDDTGLVCYYKFDESSLSVPNSSQSAESGGTNFDATAVGATTNVSGKYGDCFSMDGIDDVMQPDISGGINLSQWNWLKNGDDWSMSYWLKRTTTDEQQRLWDQAYDGGATLANATTNYLNKGDGVESWGSNLMVTNNTAGRPLDLTLPNTYYYGTDWHFYVHTFSGTDFRSLLDNANEYTASSSTSFSPNNATTNMTFFRTVGSGQELACLVQGWTFWNVVISQDNIDYLWNDGTGQGVYP